MSSWDVLKHSWVLEGVVDWTRSLTNMAAWDWVIPPYIPLAYILHSESLLSKLFILAISRNCRILSSFLARSVTCVKKMYKHDDKFMRFPNLKNSSTPPSPYLKRSRLWTCQFSGPTVQSWYCFCHNKNAADPDPSWLALLRNTSHSDTCSSSSNKSRVLATHTFTFFVSSFWNSNQANNIIFC